jgi:hypothetical protein
MTTSNLSETFIDNLSGGVDPNLRGLDHSSRTYGSDFGEDDDEDGEYTNRLSNFSFDDGSVIMDPRDAPSNVL